MEDKIYMKTKDDGILEKNATLGFGLYLIVYLIVFFYLFSDLLFWVYLNLF